MNHAKMSLAARRQKWLELVAEYRRRGISAALFCKEHGFHSDTFRYWLKKIDSIPKCRAKPSTLTRFISLAPTAPQPPRIVTPRIVLPNGVAIELNAGLEAPAVSSFLKSICGVNPSSEIGGLCAKS